MRVVPEAQTSKWVFRCHKEGEVAIALVAVFAQFLPRYARVAVAADHTALERLLPLLSRREIWQSAAGARRGRGEGRRKGQAGAMV